MTPSDPTSSPLFDVFVSLCKLIVTADFPSIVHGPHHQVVHPSGSYDLVTGHFRPLSTAKQSFSIRIFWTSESIRHPALPGHLSALNFARGISHAGTTDPDPITLSIRWRVNSSIDLHVPVPTAFASQLPSLVAQAQDILNALRPHEPNSE